MKQCYFDFVELLTLCKLSDVYWYTKHRSYSSTPYDSNF